MNIEKINDFVSGLLTDIAGQDLDEMRSLGKERFNEMQENFTESEQVVIIGHLMEELDKMKSEKNAKIKELAEETGRHIVSMFEEQDCTYLLPESKINVEDWLTIVEDVRKDYLVGFKGLVTRDKCILIEYRGYKDIMLCFEKPNIDSIKEVYEELQKTFK
ncbi:MAG: hypothetical protein ACRCX2_10035 [Paraclostridium sp.]